MAEYIKRQSVHAMVKSLKQYSWTSPVSNETHVTVAVDDMALEIDKIPAADVAPVVHGRWIDNKSHGYEWAFNCSECGYIDGYPFEDRHKYCPNCGARMDGESGIYIECLEDVIQDITSMEVTDAVRVVRCKNCEYGKDAKVNKKGYRICPASHMEITDDDFCSYGERKST